MTQQKEKKPRSKDPGANGSKTLTTPQGQQTVLRRLAHQDLKAMKTGVDAQLGPTYMANQNVTPVVPAPKRLVKAEDGTWEFR